MRELILIIITNIIFILPFSIFPLIPFWGDWKLSKTKFYAVLVLFNVGLIICSVIIVLSGAFESGLVQQIYNMVMLLVVLVFIIFTLKTAVLKILNVYFLAVTYLAYESNLIFYIQARFIPEYFNNYANIFYIIPHTVLLLVTAPFFILFLRRTLRPVIVSSSASAWRNIWIIPFMFFMVVTIYNGTYDANRLGEPRFLIITLLLAVSSFLLYYVVIKMVIHSEENARVQAEKESLERLAGMEREMVAAISHETRTPLAVLSGYTGLISMELRAQGISEQTALDLDKVAAETQRIANMLKQMQMITLSKGTEAKKIPLDIGEIVRQIARLYEPILQRRNVKLELQIIDNLPFVLGNPDELTQVIFNLLSNAKNHTENGVIRVEIKDENDNVYVIITDTGTGISPEIVPRLFERGVSDSGSGFGLAVCKDIIDSHEGRISIESNYGIGTVVSFSLPVHCEVEEDGR